MEYILISIHIKIAHKKKKKKIVEQTSDGSLDNLPQVRSYRRITPTFVPSTIASNDTSKQVYSMLMGLKLSCALSLKAWKRFFTPCSLVLSHTWPIKVLGPNCTLCGRESRRSLSGSNSAKTISLPMTKSAEKIFTSTK